MAATARPCWQNHPLAAQTAREGKELANRHELNHRQSHLSPPHSSPLLEHVSKEKHRPGAGHINHLRGVRSASLVPLPNQAMLTQKVAHTLQNETIQT